MIQLGTRATLLLITLSILGSIFTSEASVILNVTAPDGSSNHNSTDLICTPVRWHTGLIFFAANFFAHAATVRSLPGERIEEKILTVMLALFFPFSGIGRGVEAIVRHASWPPWGKISDLEVAARSGALCTIIRTELWTPENGMIVLDCERKRRASDLAGDVRVGVPRHGLSHNTELTELSGIEIQYTRKVNGSLQALERYKWAILPSNARVDPHTYRRPGLSNTYSIPQIVVAIIQVTAGSITLYRSRGYQLERYGYAAFGLTVVPYVIMSLVNLLGNLVTPDYPKLYMVRSRELEEAEAYPELHKTQGRPRFNGVVGRLVQPPTTDSDVHFLGTFRGAQSGAILKLRRPSRTFDVYRPFEYHDASSEGSLPVLSGPASVAPLSDTIQQIPAEPVADTISQASNDLRVKFAENVTTDQLDIAIPQFNRFSTTGRQRWSKKPIKWWLFTSGAVLGAIPYAVIGGLTGFHAKKQHKGRASFHDVLACLGLGDWCHRTLS